jgi:hypothetical protein
LLCDETIWLKMFQDMTGFWNCGNQAYIIFKGQFDIQALYGSDAWILSLRIKAGVAIVGIPFLRENPAPT